MSKRFPITAAVALAGIFAIAAVAKADPMVPAPTTSAAGTPAAGAPGAQNGTMNATGPGAVATETDDAITMSGLHALHEKRYADARKIFAGEAAQDPSSPYPQYNLARTYRAMGQRATAVKYYRMVAASGTGVHPTMIDEMPANGRTLHDAACSHLKTMRVRDANCSR